MVHLCYFARTPLRCTFRRPISSDWYRIIVVVLLLNSGTIWMLRGSFTARTGVSLWCLKFFFHWIWFLCRILVSSLRIDCQASYVQVKCHWQLFRQQLSACRVLTDHPHGERIAAMMVTKQPRRGFGHLSRIVACSCRCRLVDHPRLTSCMRAAVRCQMPASAAGRRRLITTFELSFGTESNAFVLSRCLSRTYQFDDLQRCCCMTNDNKPPFVVLVFRRVIRCSLRIIGRRLPALYMQSWS